MLGKTDKLRTVTYSVGLVYYVWVGHRDMIYGSIIRLFGSKVSVLQCPEIPAFGTVCGETWSWPNFPTKYPQPAGQIQCEPLGRKSFGGLSFI